MAEAEVDEKFYNIPYASSADDCKKIVRAGIVKSFAAWFSVGQIPASSMQIEMMEQDYSCTSDIIRSVFDIDMLIQERNKHKIVQSEPDIKPVSVTPPDHQDLVQETKVEPAVVVALPLEVEVRIEPPIIIIQEPAVIKVDEIVVVQTPEKSVEVKLIKDDVSKRKVRFSRNDGDDDDDDDDKPVEQVVAVKTGEVQPVPVIVSSSSQPIDINPSSSSSLHEPLSPIRPPLQQQPTMTSLDSSSLRSMSISMDRLEYDVSSISSKRHELFLPPSMQAPAVEVKLSNLSNWEVYDIVISNAVINGKKRTKTHFLPICSLRSTNCITFERFDCKAGFVIIVNDAFRFKPATIKDLLMMAGVMKQSADSASGILSSLESKHESSSKTEPDDWIASYRKDRESKKNRT